MQAFKRDISKTLTRLVPDVLFTSSRVLTLSDIWCEERKNVHGLFLFLQGKRLRALAKEASYLLRLSHRGADVSLKYTFVIISLSFELLYLNKRFVEFLVAVSFVFLLFSYFI